MGFIEDYGPYHSIGGSSLKIVGFVSIRQLANIEVGGSSLKIVGLVSPLLYRGG